LPVSFDAVQVPVNCPPAPLLPVVPAPPVAEPPVAERPAFPAPAADVPPAAEPPKPAPPIPLPATLPPAPGNPLVPAEPPPVAPAVGAFPPADGVPALEPNPEPPLPAGAPPPASEHPKPVAVTPSRLAVAKKNVRGEQRPNLMRFDIFGVRGRVMTALHTAVAAMNENGPKKSDLALRRKRGRLVRRPRAAASLAAGVSGGE
jgi:hypothetical protein